MDVLHLRAFNTGHFTFTRDLSRWAAVYPLADGRFRMQMRHRADDPLVLFEWSSENGRILFDPMSKALVVSAALPEIKGFVGTYIHDCRFEYLTAAVPIFGGEITFTQGVTR